MLALADRAFRIAALILTSAVSMSKTLDFPQPSQIVQSLGLQIRDMETRSRPRGITISSGCSAIDRVLPNGGYASGSLVEFLANGGQPLGSTTVALSTASHACEAGKYLVLIDTPIQYYPPALQRLGLPVDRIIGLRPKTYEDIVWAIDQSLRSSAVGCVIASIDRLNDRTARRFQLAAEAGGGLGILLRDATVAKSEPSWSDVQWLLAPQSHILLSSQLSEIEPHSTRWFEMILQRCHGGRSGARVRVGMNVSGEWIDMPSKEVPYGKTRHVHLAAELAKPTRIRREAAG